MTNNTIDYYIAEFTKYHGGITDADAKDLIYRFLYELINTNISGFSKLFSNKSSLREQINIEHLQFSEADKEVISSFINWENDGKNKAIFDIASYGIEYCLISNNYEGTVHLDSLRNKTFYLDTNVLFRALGINGDNRKSRTQSFLEMFSEAKEQLLVSKFTDLEFKSTVKYYVNKINKYNSRTIDPRVFISVKAQNDFFNFYHKWRVDKVNSSLSLFESHIIYLYEKLLKKYNITIDYKIPFDDRDDKNIAKINDLACEILHFKSIDNPKNTNGNEPSNWDAKNIYLIEKQRKGKDENIFETKYFFISTDQGLRRWDFQRKDTTPIVLLPSQWMSILLRYMKRTTDDFKSFVSFLNLPHTEHDITYEKLQLILTGISEITEKVESQAAIINILVSRKFTDVIQHGYNDFQIIEKSKEFAKYALEQDINVLKTKLSSLENRIDGDAAITKFKSSELIDVKAENASLKDLLKQNHINAEMKKWKRLAYYLIPVGLILSSFMVLQQILTTLQLNYPYHLVELIDAIKSETQKNTLMTLMYSPLAGMGLIIKICWSRLLSAESISKKHDEIVAAYDKQKNQS